MRLTRLQWYKRRQYEMLQNGKVVANSWAVDKVMNGAAVRKVLRTSSRVSGRARQPHQACGASERVG